MTWMYKIATNVCLTALSGRARRPLPTGLGQPSSDPHGVLESRPEVPWLEPLPDAMVWGGPAPDPAATVVDRESVRLAFVAALQHLTPPQRAVVLLRDVLAWPAAEVAELLGMSVAAVNSSLQRARVQLPTLDPGAAERAVDDDWAKALLVDYVAAFERYDVPKIVNLLSADAVWEMPPFTGWYAGPSAIGALIETNCPAQQLQLPRVGPDGVRHVACFFDTDLFARFGLPGELPPVLSCRGLAGSGGLGAADAVRRE